MVLIGISNSRQHFNYDQYFIELLLKHYLIKYLNIRYVYTRVYIYIYIYIKCNYLNVRYIYND